MQRSAEHWVLLAGASAAALVLLAFGLWVEPDPRGYGTHERLGLPPCLPMQLWHVPCPGCGVTTAFALAAHGRVLSSLANQPLGCVIALSIPLTLVWAWSVHVRGRDLRSELGRLRTWPLAILLVLLGLAAWVYKLALVRGWIH
jgi:hypothetical protein